MKCLLILLFGCLTMPYARAQHAATKPVPIIFDTDFGPDYDDVGAIAVLHALADNGECTLLATMGSNKYQHVGPALSAFNTWFKRPEVPVGVVRGDAVDIGAWQKWDSLVVARHPHAIKSNAGAQDALDLYRKILSQQPDSSVTIVTVGFFTNMANLLTSAPDSYSSLAGRDLVRKKVKRMVSMAGCFDSRIGTFKEFNVMKDSAASVIVFEHWPTQIIFSGFEIGAAIHTGLPFTRSGLPVSPVKEVFAHCIPMDANDKNGRMSWDETAVLVAVRGYEKYFGVVKGTITGNIDGSNNWNYNGERDLFLTPKMAVSELENLLNDLMMHGPKGER